MAMDQDWSRSLAPSRWQSSHSRSQRYLFEGDGIVGCSCRPRCSVVPRPMATLLDRTTWPTTLILTRPIA